MSRGITGFLVTTALGLLAYVAAELAARWTSARPRQVYVSRLICLALFFVLLALLYLPSTVEAFTGPAIRYYRLGVGAKSTGVQYGTMTWIIWFIVALLERPRRLSHGKAELAAPPNGGPATPSGTLGVQEGPPSVS